jgi:hypothetical protein
VLDPSFDTARGKIDEFILPDNGWRQTRQKIVQRATEKGANVAMVRFQGNLMHGYSVRTALYHADSQPVSPRLRDGSCSITIFRDDGPRFSDHSYAVTLNGVLFRFFADQSFVRTDVAGCPDSVDVKVNRRTHKLAMHGRSRYFRLVRREGAGGMAMPVAGGGVAVMVPLKSEPAYDLQEIENEELGHLLSDSQNQRPPARR